MISSIFCGFNSFIKRFIPPLSNWNTPSVRPEEIISKTFLSSKSIFIILSSMFIVASSKIPARRAASCITVNVRSPKKSIFKSPSSSSVVMVNCVVTVPSAALESGIYSSTGFGLIKTPAAWIEICLGSPSRRLDMSISPFACSSVS